jgi:ATPase family associated with various cellular activities (AAA)
MEVFASNGLTSATSGADAGPAVMSAASPLPPPRHESLPNRSSEAAPLSIPPEPASLADSGLPWAELESLVLKILLQRGACTGSVVAEVACMPRSIVAETLDRIRNELLVTIKSSSGIQDYVYQLTEAGFKRAQQYASRCNFIGPAPVVFDDYVASIYRQSLQRAPFTLNQLQRALASLALQPSLISQIGQALNDGRGLFLYGAPGNGKTSIAERVCSAFGQCVWIPQIVTIHGELMRIYDPSCHEIVKSPQVDALKYDRRWVLIRRPTIVVGGELTLDYLETRFNTSAGIAEAPVQLKANCGTLVIDDFGRQRVSSTEILNRLIVPLEKHYDFLYLASGRQVQVPFDELLVLSTNLEPRDLLDEAFLRRIPYKIEIGDPTEVQFRELVKAQAAALGFQVEQGAIDHLIEQHYRRAHRPYRFCHPRDLLRQIKNYCEVHAQPKRLTPDNFDLAVQNYFAGL